MRFPSKSLVVFFAVAPSMAQEKVMVPVTIDGSSVRLEMVVHKPATSGPAPTLVFHHGSTGSGRDPRAFTQTWNPAALTRHFVERGWAVVLPSRRGRGGSDGFYDEGFSADRSFGYACQPRLSLPGAERALKDIDAATDAILAMPFVDRARLLVGGQSRGGILSVAWAGMRPGRARGVVNFVGGWVGARCSSAVEINGTLFRRGAAHPGETAWLYGDNDPFYPLAHSEANFAAFQAAGGKGRFHR